MSPTDTGEHFARLRHYFARSERNYELMLGGAKHFGYHPDDRRVSEREAQGLLHDLVAERLALGPGDRVLDAGCGQGVVACDLVRKTGCRIDGITVLDFEVPKAEARARAAGVEARTRFQIMDYSETGFDDAAFDAIYTTETLSHSPDIRRTLHELNRVLKPGGRVAFFEYSIAETEAFSPREWTLFERIARGSAMVGLHEFRNDRFHDVMEEAGFRDVRTENITANMLPSLRRLQRLALLPYYLVTWPLGRQERNPNRSAAVVYHAMVRKGLVRYNIFTARK
ncbi:MAG: tocopherol O-methyltransferase [Rhodobacteraceae bacterium HLUCCA12]|nr:MAG: tocopherol O-methyltransferase [Rhodobacteraceae bacterium HLUCCA12]